MTAPPPLRAPEGGVPLVSLKELGAAVRAAHSPVAIRGGQLLSWATFLARVHAWRNTLASRPGATWALHFGDSFEFACALLGAWHAGKAVLLPGETQPGAMEWLEPLADGFVGEFPLASTLAEPDASAPSTRPVRADAETRAAVVFTSGTTGRPLAAPKTFRQLDNEVRALHAVWGDRVGTAAVLAGVPHQHFYGLLFKILWPLCRQAPFVSETLPLPHEVTRWLRGRPGIWIASPTILTRLTADPLWEATRGQLCAVFSSGGPLPLDAARRCAALFGQGVQEIYGSSETGGVGWRCRTDEDRPWRPMPGVSVRVAEGELLHLRSPWLPDAREWRTADRAEVHADATFSLLGRADRIVKVGERRVSLTAIEARLAASALVREARAVLLAEGRMGAAVVLGPDGVELLRREGARRVVEELTAVLRSHIVAVALPRRWRFVDALPANTMGKVTDDALRALLAASSSP